MYRAAGIHLTWWGPWGCWWVVNTSNEGGQPPATVETKFNSERPWFQPRSAKPKLRRPNLIRLPVWARALTAGHVEPPPCDILKNRRRTVNSHTDTLRCWLTVTEMTDNNSPDSGVTLLSKQSEEGPMEARLWPRTLAFSNQAHSLNYKI